MQQLINPTTFIVFVLVLSLTGWLGCGAESEEEVAPPEEALVAAGAQHYKRYCALCHGEKGEGYLSPAASALNNQDFLVVVSDDFLKDALVQGRPGTKMSAFGASYDGPLDEEKTEALIAFLRSWQTEDTVDTLEMITDGDPSRALETYAQQCASCHGAQGEGTSIALSLNNPVFLDSVSDGFLYYAMAEGRRGTAMASYKSSLNDQTLRDLTTLIRSWR